jgi:hypothetical protein
VTVSCEHSNEPSGFHKRREIFLSSWSSEEGLCSMELITYWRKFIVAQFHDVKSFNIPLKMSCHSSCLYRALKIVRICFYVCPSTIFPTWIIFSHILCPFLWADIIWNVNTCPWLYNANFEQHIGCNVTCITE